MKPIRLFIGSDFHCGHEVGLTPPAWNPKYDIPELQRMSNYRAYLWDKFSSGIAQFMPFDVGVFNGDLIDGRGAKIGGTEAIFVDREDQCKMASDVIRFVGAQENYITRGTDYHVGEIESWENLIAKETNSDRIGDILKINIRGLRLNVRHHISTSQVPHTRATALLREWLWDALWSDAQEEYSRADVIIRSHAHYHISVSQPGMLAMILPGLQGYGTRYGERRLAGMIHFGFVVMDVVSKEDFSWQAKTYHFPLPPETVVSIGSLPPNPLTSPQPTLTVYG